MPSKKKEIRKKYNVTSSSYDELYREEQLEKYRAALSHIKLEGVIVDAGCGTGLFEEFLAQVNALKNVSYVICLDISEGMLKHATLRLSRLALKYMTEIIESDVEFMPLRERAADYTVMFTVIDLVESERRTIFEVDRITKSHAIITRLHKALRNKLSISRIGRVIASTDKDIIILRNIATADNEASR
ncbi:MAG: class I SAM-dependent methyltransferase [Thermoproteota archaeon]